jgi:hypothetical protein
MLMKTSLRWIICCACICAFAQAAFAQTGYGRPSGGVSGATSAIRKLGAGQTNMLGDRFFHARSLVGQLVKDPKGLTLGSIYDIAFSPESGDTFASIGVGGGRYALVPWQAFTVKIGAGGQDELVLNTNLRTLQSGPAITNNQWERLNDPAFTQGVYAQFKIQSPTAIGGTQGGDLGGGSTGGNSSNAKETNKTAIAPP